LEKEKKGEQGLREKKTKKEGEHRWDAVQQEAQERRVAYAGEKRIPINHRVKHVLYALPRHLHHGFVFTYKGKPIGTRIRRSLKTDCEKAGIPSGHKIPGGFVFKDIRTSMKTHEVQRRCSQSLC
jgi:hypothetical protein